MYLLVVAFVSHNTIARSWVWTYDLRIFDSTHFPICIIRNIFNTTIPFIQASSKFLSYPELKEGYFPTYLLKVTLRKIQVNVQKNYCLSRCLSRLKIRNSVFRWLVSFFLVYPSDASEWGSLTPLADSLQFLIGLNWTERFTNLSGWCKWQAMVKTSSNNFLSCNWIIKYLSTTMCLRVFWKVQEPSVLNPHS